MRLVLTRHPGQAGHMEAAARGAGYEVAFLPLTHQQLPQDPSDLRAAVEQLRGGDFDWLLLTSPNTVRALIACGWTGRLPPETRVAAVGPGTARVLQEHTQLQPHWMAHDHSAAGILAELETPAQGQRMLLPQSAQARPALAEGLRARGWVLTHVIAYQTVPTAFSGAPQPEPHTLLPPPAAEGTAAGALLRPWELRGDDVVLVTSSSAAEAYAGLQNPQAVTLLAIGEPTAAMMHRLKLPSAAVLSEPTAEGLLTAMNEQGLSRAASSLDWG